MDFLSYNSSHPIRKIHTTNTIVDNGLPEIELWFGSTGEDEICYVSFRHMHCYEYGELTSTPIIYENISTPSSRIYTV